MDFEEILKRWENAQQPKEEQPKREPRVDMGAALERYPPKPSAETGRQAGSPQRPSPARVQRDLPPQAELDLHGLTGLEAEEAIDRFVRDAKGRGLSKVLLIHGKGNHSPGEPVLERVVRRYLEKCPHTGAFGKADRARGGRGATWVRIRQNA